MTSKAASEGGGRADTARLALAVILLVAGAIGYHYFADYSLLYRVLGLLAVAAVAVAIAVQTERGRRAVGFVRDARMEVRKVVWPTRQETVQTTLSVVVMVILVALILWVMDSVLLVLVRNLTGQGG